jgi:tetratricopeptide (TPR) repeat protein
MDSGVREQLERICRSEVFKSTPRLKDLLAFLTARQSANDPQGLKETVIGVEFFHRDPAYDPKKDPIVRVEAHRLRRRLSTYYSQEGGSDPWRLDLPKGSYAPVLRRREESPVEWRLAVLVDAADELTAEGLTVELINKLGELRGVTVIAPHSSLTTRDAAEAIRNLNANAILECFFDGMNLQAKLSRADSFGLTPIGIFDNVIQPAVEALSHFVGSSLGAALGGVAPRKRLAVDRESYQLYLSGRAWFHRWSPDNLAQAAAYFEKVIERCPEHAPAYAGLADIQVLLAYWHVASARATLERGRAYATRAVELDSCCADAYCSLAAIEATLNRDWGASEVLFRRALDTNPSSALALNWLSIIALVPQMRFEEAVDAVFAAYDLDPASPEIGNEIVWVRICCGQFEESAEQGRRIIALHPGFLEAYWSLGLAESSLGHFTLACEAFDKAELLGPEVPFTLALRSYAEGIGGNSSAAKKYLDRLQEMAKFAPVRELYYCWAYTGLGELDRAMSHLQQAVDVADPLALYVDVFVPFERLRSQPGFGRIRQQQRLPVRS